MSTPTMGKLERAADALAGGGTAGRPPWRRRWLRSVRALSRKGGSWAIADQGFVSACNFLTVYVYARTLDPASLGVLLLAYSGLRLLTALQGSVVVGPHNVLAAAMEPVEYRRFTAALVTLQVIVSTGVAALLAVAGVVMTYGFEWQYGWILMIVAIVAWPYLSRDFVRRAFFTRGNSRAATFNDVVSFGLQLAGACAIAYWGWGANGPEAALFVFGLSSLAGIIAGMRHLRRQLIFDTEALRGMTKAWSDAWRFGKWVVAKNILEWFGSRGHSWVVAIMLGTGEVGLYRAVTHLSNVMNPVRQVAANYLPSRGSFTFQTRGHAGLSRWTVKVALLLVAGLAPLCIVLVGFPHEVIHLAYGARYGTAELAEILALSTVAQIFGFLRYPLDIGILAMQATKSLFYIAILPVILLATAGVALIHTFGILGVPLSMIAMNISSLAISWTIYRRLMKRSAMVPIRKGKEMPS